jgi:hypothetical protein
MCWPVCMSIVCLSHPEKRGRLPAVEHIYGPVSYWVIEAPVPAIYPMQFGSLQR